MRSFLRQLSVASCQLSVKKRGFGLTDNRELATDNSFAICVRELSYIYPGGKQALDDISLRVNPGESVGLVGPNGAGKTTLFLCLSGVLPASTGNIRLMGLDPGDREQRRKLPARVGVVFQNSDDQIFNSTVFDDVAFGPLNLDLSADEVRQRVGQSLKSVGMTGTETRVPYHLSYGEKRRVALAGVLAMNPDIVLLDEPSTSLDPRGRRELIRLVNQLAITKMTASHDLELIRETCQRVLLLDGGRLIADGPTLHVLGDRDLMEAHGLEVPHSLTYHADAHHG
jgi:cobalt/nickel transport system ATP-binding protein